MDIKAFCLNLIRIAYYKLNFLIRKLFHSPKNREDLYAYWRSPYDNLNLPKDYLEESEYKKSRFLLSTVKQFTGILPQSKILEIGCNAGRNLDLLYRSGFKTLEAIEISDNAIQTLKGHFPQMASQIKIYNIPVEEIARTLKDSEYNLVFTMAVLEHIHVDSEWIFQEIVRITKHFLITIENEKDISWRTFPRNYKKIFEPLGMRQTAMIPLNMDNFVSPAGSGFVARVFQKA